MSAPCSENRLHKIEEFHIYTAMEILYQDEDIVAVNKPSGLLVHRSQIDRSETRFALQLVRDIVGKRVYPVHRLDKPTSGVLLFALNGDAARDMIRSFSEGRVRKRYLAVVRGHIQEQGIVDYPLVEELDDMTDRLARRNKPGQSAITEYRCLGRAELPHPVGPYPTARYSLVQPGSLCKSPVGRDGGFPGGTARSET